MMGDSPFTPDRFEYERKHLYYLPQSIFDRLEMAKPIYLVGSRGTGKTTLLHALNWKERLDNESLKQALGNDVFKNQYVGVYLRMPHFQVESFEKWLTNEEDHIRGPIFGLYLDLIWLGLIAEALSELFLRSDEFKAPPSEEHKFIDSVLDRYPQIINLMSVEKPCTVRRFSKIVNSMRRKMETFANLRADVKELYNDYPLGQVGDFGRSVAELFADFCNRFSRHEGAKWHFKICIDEAECLSVFQQRVFNTAVRLSRGIAVYVISYVSKIEDINKTLLPRITLQRADRELIILDDISDREFENLAEGVATVRIQYKINDYSKVFSVRKLLGRLDINAILNEILNVSESIRAKQLLQKAREFAKTPFFKEIGWENCNISGRTNLAAKAPPIYQAYISDKLKIKLPFPNEARWKKRSQESQEIRKKMVAAYLCICRDLKLEVRYAFAEMVFQMSDKCIRDFLTQMHEIFIEAGRGIVEFLQLTNLPIKKQDAAVKRASREKMNSLPQSGITAPIEIGRIIDGLARITAIVQTQGPKNKPLISSERGRFFIDTRSTNGTLSSNILDLLKEANEAGFLRIIESDRRRWELQVHSSLAAAYGFSYRGAYYPCRLLLSDIDKLRQAEDRENFEQAVKEIGQRLIGESPQLPLFKDREI